MCILIEPLDMMTEALIARPAEAAQIVEEAAREAFYAELYEDIATFIEKAYKTSQPKSNWLICPLRFICLKPWMCYSQLDQECDMGKLIINKGLTQADLEPIGDIIMEHRIGRTD